jgi:hypothetical protein
MAFMSYLWGWWGIALYFIYFATLGNYYFTCALMNHNAENTNDVDKRNNSSDWGES